MGLRVLIGLVYTPFMLMKVGDSQYGVYSLSLSLISFISHGPLCRKVKSA